MKILFFALIFSAATSFATTLHCELKLNTKTVLVNQIETQLQQKTLIGDRNGITAYVTEKSAGLFLIEAYLLDYDVRIYSEGPVPLTGSLWGRESMVDINCRPASSL